MTKEKKPPSLKEVKDKYLTDGNMDFIETYYGTEKSVEFARHVAALEDKDYKVVGYGSLMKESDARRSFRYLKGIEPSFLHGWIRIFNMGKMETGSYLNIQESESAKTPIALLTIGYQDVPELLLREIAYDIIDVAINGEPAIMVYQPDISQQSIGIQPMLTYLSLCIEGAKELFGYKGIDMFKDSTLTYDNKSIREWMNGFSLNNYLETHNQVSR